MIAITIVLFAIVINQSDATLPIGGLCSKGPLSEECESGTFCKVDHGLVYGHCVSGKITGETCMFDYECVSGYCRYSVTKLDRYCL